MTPEARCAIVEEIFATFAGLGGRHYGENVSQAEHMLQTAVLAERAGASDALVVAALLHDYGHFLHETQGGRPDEDGTDAAHEHLGAEHLAAWFPPSVTEPIALHVRAKAFLCARRPRYLKTLSEASRRSLALQGGPLDEQAAAAFLALPFARDAIALRCWDDAAKTLGAETPSLESYRVRMLGLMERGAAAPQVRGA